MNLTRWIDVAGRDTNMHEVHGVWEEGGREVGRECVCMLLSTIMNYHLNGAEAGGGAAQQGWWWVVVIW